MSFRVRLATEADLPAINAIYNYYVETSTSTYQLELESYADRLAWFRTRTPRYPVTVVERGQACSGPADEIVGWGALSPFRQREGYKHSVENSVYVRNDFQRRGVGRAIVVDLIDRAKVLRYHVIVAGISADQAASVALHQSLGFSEVARLPQVGRKFDRWLDVVYLALLLE